MFRNGRMLKKKILNKSMRSGKCQTKGHEECDDLLCDCWCHEDPDEKLEDDDEIDDDDLEIDDDDTDD